MDTDIAAATTAFELDKIKAQDYRNSLASQKIDRAAQLAVVQGFYAWAQTEYSSLPPELPAATRLRNQLFLTLAEKYMTPSSTATTDATIATDSANDAKRLDAAFKAASAVLP